MTTMTLASKDLEVDAEGFLTHADQWDEGVAAAIAREAGVVPLTDRHWLVIKFMRERFLTTGTAPSIRTLGKESGVPIKELYQLFPKGPAKLAAKIGVDPAALAALTDRMHPGADSPYRGQPWGKRLATLRPDFPDVTISKIRFLESQGLIDPERTPSGYRKFYDPDVDRLRVILREQRENFLPLRVIRDRLESGAIDDSGSLTPPRGIRNVPMVVPGDDGTGELLDVVCGAPNVTVAAKYPFARTGTRMPAGLVIEKRKIRGFTSNGMLCSARELGLGEDHDGIYTLDTAAANGTPLLDVLPLGDVRFVVDVLPNRPDLLSHAGVARDVAAAVKAATKSTVAAHAAAPAAKAVKIPRMSFPPFFAFRSRASLAHWRRDTGLASACPASLVDGPCGAGSRDRTCSRAPAPDRCRAPAPACARLSEVRTGVYQRASPDCACALYTRTMTVHTPTQRLDPSGVASLPEGGQLIRGVHVMEGARVIEVDLTHPVGIAPQHLPRALRVELAQLLRPLGESAQDVLAQPVGREPPLVIGDRQQHIFSVLHPLNVLVEDLQLWRVDGVRWTQGPPCHCLRGRDYCALDLVL